ncbi:DUF6527 family protein [uncultured Brevundimonas sp.]|uniref:DUF6527 family protein n=1 Tax=uncultured Brevundimonas sp. TaxID=213418 RepID=UPI0025CD94E4|nr:DUF6527 family protein [uncultured Brevundimonas sp.]
MTRALIVDDLDHVLEPGAVEIREVLISDSEKSVGLAFICPCGCGREGYLPTDVTTQGPRWDWNGDRERPTVRPSVQFVGGCKWHGFLTNGEWRAC